MSKDLGFCYFVFIGRQGKTQNYLVSVFSSNSLMEVIWHIYFSKRIVIVVGFYVLVFENVFID